MGGSEDDVKYYENMAKESGLDRKTIFKGRLDHDKLAIFQKACDVLLMPFPKTTHYELYMSPLKLFEYMAGQRPIITSDLPSVREIISDEQAVFYKPDDINSLIKAIKYCVDNPKETANKAQSAYELVKQYTWEKRANNIVKFIQNDTP